MMKNVLAESVPSVNIGDTFGSPFGVTKSIGNLVSIILSGSLVVAGIIVVFLLVFGGLQMIIGAGNSDPKASAQGHQAITWAVIGFIIVFSAFIIISLIERFTGTTFITAPHIYQDTCGTGPGPC